MNSASNEFSAFKKAISKNVHVEEDRLHKLASEAESIFARAITIPTTEQISTKQRLKRIAEINTQITPTEFWAKRFENFILAPSVYEFIMDPRTEKFFMETITLPNMDTIGPLLVAYKRAYGIESKTTEPNLLNSMSSYLNRHNFVTQEPQEKICKEIDAKEAEFRIFVFKTIILSLVFFLILLKAVEVFLR